MAKKKQYAIYHRIELIPVTLDTSKRWERKIIDSRVVVMATAGSYAMVRHPGCMPFVAELKKLTFED